MKLSTTLRFFAGISLILILNFLFFSGLIQNALKKDLTEKTEYEALLRIARGLAAVLPNLEPDSVSETLSLAAESTNSRITMIEKNGSVIFDSEKDHTQMDNHNNRPEVIAARNNTESRAIRYSSTLEEKYMYCAVLISESTGTVLRVSAPMTRVLSSPLIIKGFPVYLMTILFISLILGFILSLYYSKPIRDLLDFTKDVSSGDFSIRMHPRGSGELSELARGFNAMAVELGNLISELRRSESVLNTTFRNLKDGVALISSEGKVITMNKTFSEICRIEESSSEKEIWRMVESPEINTFIADNLSKKTSVSRRLYRDKKELLFTSIPIPESSNTLFILQDLSHAQRYMKMKKDLVANVSHELRTPVTSIRGFAETLEEELKGDQKEYAGIIKRNAQRLISITNDLLTLSTLEREEALTDLKEVDLAHFLENNSRIFTSRFKEQGLEFKIEEKGNPVKVFVDAYRIEQVFTNLIDNALKYTAEGGVTVEIEYMDREVRISFYDTGTGIPAGSKEKIFNRFYVADKSRSRELGGTGLGLSIVKHITELHGGHVEAGNRASGGAVFTITLPVKKS